MKMTALAILAAITLPVSACGGDAPEAGQAAARKQSPGEPNAMSSHTVSGMKKALDDARAVEGLLQQRDDQQGEEMDNISR